MAPAKKRGSWRVEWLDGKKEGMTHFVLGAHLLCEWKMHAAIAADEQRKAALREYNVSVGYYIMGAGRRAYEYEDPESRAIGDVFGATGEPNVAFTEGTLHATPDVIERIRARAKSVLDLPKAPAYTDRGGTLHLPYDYARALAKEFCIQEPVTVLTDINATEEEMMHDIQYAGQGYRAQTLTRYRAGWAIVRQWVGPDAAIITHTARIERLLSVILRAAHALERAGLKGEATRALQALKEP